LINKHLTIIIIIIIINRSYRVELKCCECL